MAIGYWHSPYIKDLPKVEDFENETVDEEKRALLISYLNRGKIHVIWRGFSQCRYHCDTPMDKMAKHALPMEPISGRRG